MIYLINSVSLRIKHEQLCEACKYNIKDIGQESVNCAAQEHIFILNGTQPIKGITCGPRACKFFSQNKFD